MKKFTHIKAGKFEIVKSSNMRPTGKLITGGFSSASVITTPEKEKSEFRTNYNSNRKTFREAELLMFSNYESKEKTSYITLMYEVPEFDSKKFHRDIKVFVKSLKRAYPENQFKYICATELGHNLSYHAHLLIFWENKAPNDIAKYWKHGRAFRKEIQKDEHFSYIVRYLTGYNRQVDDDETEELFGELTRDEIACINYYHGGVTLEKKKVIKTERLKKMPAKLRLFPHSINMKKPEIKELEEEEYEALLNAGGSFHYQVSSTKEINGFTARFEYAARFVR